MRDEKYIREILEWVKVRHDLLIPYRDACARIADHHGVQDASSDLRELDAAEAALRWVLGERETLGY